MKPVHWLLFLPLGFLSLFAFIFFTSHANYNNISAVVLPHHDLVKAQRFEFLKKISRSITPPKTIILISPNHFDSGSADIQTTDRVWKLPGGQIYPDLKVISGLVKSGIGLQPESFTNEHGIKNILSDIHVNFPQSNLVPLIIKKSVNPEEIKHLSDILLAGCFDCLVIGSVDFSHYQPALLANLHDDLSLRLLQNLDTQNLYTDAEVDSPATLAFLTLWANSHSTFRFVPYLHTNSGEILKNPYLESTSHIFGWYETGSRSLPAKEVSFTVGGDMMFGRYIAQKFPGNSLFQSLTQLGDRVFWGVDASVINLEGPISDKLFLPDPDIQSLIFNFPKSTTLALQYLGVKSVSLANNHSQNAGLSGLNLTRNLLQSAKIIPISGPTPADIYQIATFSGSGFSLSVLGVNTFSRIPDLMPVIQKLKSDPANKVMVFAHWGREYESLHSASQAKLARSWIDAGADLIIGSHPHVIQDIEVYKNKPIFYSLGNLLFDQRISPATEQGIILAGKFTATGLEIFALPTVTKNFQPQMMSATQSGNLLRKFYSPIVSYMHPSPAGQVAVFPY